MRICTTKCPHCDGKIKIEDVFRGSAKFKYKKCEICGCHVTKKQLFSRATKGINYSENRKYWHGNVRSRLQAHKNWNEKYGDLLGGEYDHRQETIKQDERYWNKRRREIEAAEKSRSDT